MNLLLNEMNWKLQETAQSTWKIYLMKMYKIKTLDLISIVSKSIPRSLSAFLLAFGNHTDCDDDHDNHYKDNSESSQSRACRFGSWPGCTSSTTRESYSNSIHYEN